MEKATDPKDDLLCPSKIGPYQLRGTIGSGGYATVKLAYRADRDQFFACKIIRRKRIHSDYECKSFESEIRILQQLRCPHIVALCELFKDNLNYYLMMEFCPNGDLFNVIVKLKRVPEAAAKVFIQQVLIALEYLHQRDIGHRDVKPENIMIDENGNARLTDFGLAKYAPPGVLTSTSCGSPYYVSPEIISNAAYSPQKSDMWSIGVVIFAMVSGQVPWKSTNRQMIFDQIKSGQYAVPPTTSIPCANLISKLMVVDPSHRLTAKQALQHEWFASCPSLGAVEVSCPVLSL
jgi:serine/threonine protein kinase